MMKQVQIFPLQNRPPKKPKISKSIKKKMNFIYVFLITFVLRTIFTRSHKARYVVRFVLFVFGMLSSGFLTIVSAMVLYPIGKGIWVNRIQARLMAIVAPLLAGIDVDIVSGKEHLKFTGPCVYVSNHQANLDMLVLAETLAERAVICAKSEIKYWPIIGQVLFAGQNIFIDRKNRKNAIDAMNSVGKRMKDKNLALWM
ncbi:hypothetical protein HDV01_007139 [Terramyces sp. JEL0728]|nr:hypothetical protein HDV01_007139 [Terramyces sp. JEL0728]